VAVSELSVPDATELELENLETELFLEGLFRRYGFDFRQYAPSSIQRRIRTCMKQEGSETVSALQDKLLHDAAAMDRFLLAVTVNVTEMFRDPAFYRAFRDKVAPLLRERRQARIWHAGCSTGEEVYSLVILLREEGLGDLCRIYATDLNEAVLGHAKEGIFSLSLMRKYRQNYLDAGARDRWPTTIPPATATSFSMSRCGATSSSRSTTWPPTVRSTSLT
jgi:chemotaxis protein methyltransferase CheR